MDEQKEVEEFIANCIKINKGEIFFNRKPFNITSDWLPCDETYAFKWLAQKLNERKPFWRTINV